MPPLYNAYEAKLLNVLHSKLCKEKKKKMISLSWATCPFWRKVVYFQGRTALTLIYFHGRLAHTNSHWSIFTSDHPRTLTLVYFHGQPAHTQTHTGLFSRATTHTHLPWSILWATCPSGKKEEWSHCNGWPTQVEEWPHCNGWPT
jgi:hypothetical protein